MFLFRLAFWFVRFGVKFVLAVALLGMIVVVLYASFWLPDVAFLAENPPETTAFIERTKVMSSGQGESVRIRRAWVPLDKISPHLTTAVRVAEDDRFYLHNGFDFTEIKNSFEKNLKEGRLARGGSTISQQLAKNLYLSPDKTLRRKFDEMLLTWKLEKNLTKDRILELYLNVVDWGNGCFGAEAASRFYFSKPALNLTEREAANLAARLPSPGYYSSYSGEKKRRERERIILARMKEAGTPPGKAERVALEKRKRAAGTEGPSKPPESDNGPEDGTLPKVLEIARSIEPLRRRLTEVFTSPEKVPVVSGENPETSTLDDRNDWNPLSALKPRPDGSVSNNLRSETPGEPKTTPQVILQGPVEAPPIGQPGAERFRPTDVEVAAPPPTTEKSHADRLKEQIVRLQNALSD